MTDEVIIQIPIDQLHESPFNPRRRFHGIKELADTMRPPNGRVLQALLVRPIVPPLFAGEADLAASAVAGYEVVFGHRRRRAGIEAELATLPCVVRAMGDAEARHCQVVENLQRDDVHPFEEAEGFMQLIAQDGLTADEVAEQFGKSRSYVYGRLKLLQACPEVRDACLDGKIGSEVALLVARLRTNKLQEKALAAIRNDTSTSAKLDDGGKRSFRHIRDLLIEKFTLDLRSAIFDPEDATLCPDAGSCSACPKRSGNAPEFEDLAAKQRDTEHYMHHRAGGPDICTDPDCFADKKAAHLQRKAAEAAQDGGTVISGNKAKAAIGADGRLKGYVPLKDARAAFKGKGQVLYGSEIVTIVNQRTGQTIKAVKAAAMPAGSMKTEQPRGQQRDWEAERRERAAAVQAETERRAALHAQIRPRMLAAEPSTMELRLVVWLALQGIDWQVEERTLARHGITSEMGYDRRSFAWLDGLAPDTLRVLLMDLLLDQACDVEHEVDSNLALFDLLAGLYGVATDGTSTPSTAGAGAEQSEPAAAKVKATGTKRPGVKYHCVATGQTWSGRGLQPAWVKAARRGGKNLTDLAVEGKDKEAKVDAGSAGERTANAGLFEEAGA